MKKILTAVCLAIAALFMAVPDATAASLDLAQLAENMNQDKTSGIVAHYNGTFFQITDYMTEPKSQKIIMNAEEEELRTLVAEDDNFRAIMNMLYNEGAAFMMIFNCGDYGERSIYYTVPEEKAILGY